MMHSLGSGTRVSSSAWSGGTAPLRRALDLETPLHPVVDFMVSTCKAPENRAVMKAMMMIPTKLTLFGPGLGVGCGV